MHPIIYRVSYIPGGAGFQPSTVLSVFPVIKVHEVWIDFEPVLGSKVPLISVGGRS